MTDELIQSLLKESASQEALGWLRAGSDTDFRSIGELETTEEAIQLVELLHNAGAVEVWAVEIEESPEGQNTGTLVIRLPDDPEKRTRLFEWAETVADQQELEQEQDIGQRYLLVELE